MHQSLPFRSLESRRFTLQIHHGDIRGGSVATLRLLVWWLGNKLHSQGKAFFSRSHFNWIWPCCSSWHNNTKGLESLSIWGFTMQNIIYSNWQAIAMKRFVIWNTFFYCACQSFKHLTGASISKCMKENYFTPWQKHVQEMFLLIPSEMLHLDETFSPCTCDPLPETRKNVQLLFAHNTWSLYSVAH